MFPHRRRGRRRDGCLCRRLVHLPADAPARDPHRRRPAARALPHLRPGLRRPPPAAGPAPRSGGWVGRPVRVMETAGSAENVALLRDGGAELALIQTTSLNPDGVAGVAPLFPE